MFRFLLCLTICGFIPPAFSQSRLRVYTYDALTGRDSLGEYLSREFLKDTGIQVQMVSFGTAGEAANQILLEGKNCQADILMGIDEILFNRLKEKKLFDLIDAQMFQEIEPFLKENSRFFLPFDYGYLSFVYDERRTTPPKKNTLRSFSQTLQDSQKVVLQDPRTSSLGSEFLIWTKQSLGAQFDGFWKELNRHILTISPGWTGAYELFLKKQADYVLSYTTSPTYHRMRESLESIKPLYFEEGHFRQVEGAVLLSSSGKKSEAKKFLSFLIGPSVQERLPTFQWMYPSRRKIQLPKAFVETKIPKAIPIDWTQVASHKDAWVKEWTLIMSQEIK